CASPKCFRFSRVPAPCAAALLGETATPARAATPRGHSRSRGNVPMLSPERAVPHARRVPAHRDGARGRVPRRGGVKGRHARRGGGDDGADDLRGGAGGGEYVERGVERGGALHGRLG